MNHHQNLGRNFSRSLRAIRDHVDKFSIPLTPRIEHVPNLILGANGKVVDLVIDNRPIYGGSADLLSVNQVKEFYRANNHSKKVLTIILKDDRTTYETAERLDRALDVPIMLKPHLAGIDENYSCEPDYCGTLLIFGLGLGYHIEELINTYNPIRVFIFEPNLNIWAASLAALNWQALLQKCKVRNIAVSLLYIADLGQAPYAIINALKAGPASAIPFSRYFFHAGTPILLKVAEEFIRLEYYLNSSSGYFADEMRQLVETNKNLKNHRVLKQNLAREFSKNRKGIVVVGSGPSLDHSIGLLETLSATCTVMSCGTALQRLISENIIPDVHVELETHPDAFRSVFDNIKGKDALSDIILFCSSGAPQLIMDHFYKTRLFFRSNVACTYLFENEHLEVPHSFGRVGAAGASIAAYLGYDDVILLGMDNGYKFGDVDTHAKDTIYDSENAATLMDSFFEGAENLTADMAKSVKDERATAKIELPSVTGEKMLLTDTFFQAYSSLNGIIQANPNIKFYQVGYGVALSGAQNLTPEKFGANLPVCIKLDKSFFINDEQFVNICSNYQARVYKLKAEMFEVTSKLIQLYEREVVDFAGWLKNELAVVNCLDDILSKKFKVAVSLIRGAVLLWGRCTAERAFFFKEPAQRNNFLSLSRRHAIEMLHGVRAELDTVFQPRTLSEGQDKGGGICKP